MHTGIDGTGDGLADITSTATNMTSGPAEKTVFQPASAANVFTFITPLVITADDFIGNKTTLQVMLAYDTDSLILSITQCTIWCPLEDPARNGLDLAPIQMIPIIYHTTQEVWKETYYYNATNAFFVMILPTRLHVLLMTQALIIGLHVFQCIISQLLVQLQAEKFLRKFHRLFNVII